MRGKPAEADDPTLLVGLALPDGDAELMAACLVEEYVRLGTSDKQLLSIFRSPFFAGAHAIFLARGEAYVRDLITRARAQWGHPRYTVRTSRTASGFAGPSAGFAGAIDVREVSEGAIEAPSDEPRGAKPPSED